MRTALALLACAALGCNTSAPVLLPPPFGPTAAPTPYRLYFPTGLAVTKDQSMLLVANGDFDHAFDASTMVALDTAYLGTLFDQQLDCSHALYGAPAKTGCDIDVLQNQQAFLGAAIIGNYSGPLALYEPASGGTTAFVAARDTNLLHAVSVGAPGQPVLSCRNHPGVDCRDGVQDLLATATLEGPYAVVLGDVVAPGSSVHQDTLFVGELVPHINVVGDTTLTQANVAALDAANPTAPPLFTMVASDFSVTAGAGIGPMAFDPVRRQLYASGCYTRYPNPSQGAPLSAKCAGASANYLRELSPDAGANAGMRAVSISEQIRSTDTSDLLLGELDPVTGAHTLFATVRTPDALLTISIPDDPTREAQVQHATALPVSPGAMLRIPRPGLGDLLLISATKTGLVDVFDVAQDQVVGQIERLGDTPFAMARLPSPANVARVAVSVFGDCRIGLMEVPLDKPWNATLRARVGACPP
jgi:hypothetical protein